MDAVTRMIEQWRSDARAFERAGQMDLVELTRSHVNDLQKMFETLADTRVPYAHAEELTGYSLGGLKNQLRNIGTRSQPAFRLGDLPFRFGRASDGKFLLAASTILRLTRE
jgi:hypothetical protein